MRTVMAVAITVVCLVVVLQLRSLDAADEVKGPKVTEKVRVVVSCNHFELLDIFSGPRNVQNIYKT